MKVIAVVNPKGGSGKTTSVINVTEQIARLGFRVAAVDTDGQKSLSNWSKKGETQVEVFSAENEKDVYQVRKNLAGFDYVVIDGAASLSVITAAAVMVSDLVIIPVSPSPLDFGTAGCVLDVLEAQAFNRPVKAAFLITRKVEGTTMLKSLKESIASTGIPCLKVGLGNRQSYVKTLIHGGSVFDSRDGDAKGEVAILTRDILNMLND